MKTIQNQTLSEDLKRVIERIVEDLEEFELYRGKLSIERELPPDGTPSTTPAGYPHLALYEEQITKYLGLIPHKEKKMICVVKEGFYDTQENGRKDVLVLLRSKDAEAIVKKHLEEYGIKYQVTEIVYKT